jgi:hypothetical protein
MERIKQKLHSRRGASIILAMLLMMVAVMVSAVIISASYTAAKRVNDDSDRQQGLLTASSAARFVAEDLRGVEFSKTTTQYYVYNPYKDENEDTYYVKEPTGAPIITWTPASDDGSGGLFNTALRQIAEKADYGYEVEGEYDLLISPPEGTSLLTAIFHFTLEADGEGFKLKDPLVYTVSSPDDRGDADCMENSKNKIWMDDISVVIDFTKSGSYSYELEDGTIKTWRVTGVKLMTANEEG